MKYRASVLLFGLALLAAVSGCSSQPAAGSNEPLQIKVPRGPVGLAPTDDGVWVVSSGADSVTKLSGSGKVTSTEQTPPVPLRAAMDGDRLWVTSFEDNVVAEIGGGTVDVGDGAEGIAVDGQRIWVVAQDDGRLVRLDGGKVTARINVETGARLVIVGENTVFVSNYAQGNIVAINPARNKVRSSKFVCAGPQGMALHGDLLWVACTLGESVVAVDPVSLKIRHEIRLPGSPDAVRATDEAVYVALQAGPTLVKINPDSAMVEKKVSLGKQLALADQANIDLAITGDYAWISSFSEDAVYRVNLP